MHNKLSLTSRLLVAFASGALIAVFFLPAWRIDLFAPQYPEGLTMNIWINGLSGDVEIINGLNHYIGMKPISEEMFPEFRFLPYVVGLFMVLGMIVALSGKRRLLLLYLALTVIAGSLAMYDFYKWGYDYGHNLDPNAPIQVEGLSYQPPLFGHKRLLNFDAYSFPDAGGWIVIGAATLAFGVWFAEWYKNRKTMKPDNMKYAVTLILLSGLLLSCSAQPEPFKYGTDNCHTCKMTIMDAKFGCQVITKKGVVYKFDDIICTSGFLHQGEVPGQDIRQTVVINFEKENDFLDVEKAFFVHAPGIKSPMNSHVAAFGSPASAEKFSREKKGEILSWAALREKFQ